MYYSYSLGEVWDVFTRPSNLCAALAIVCVHYRSRVADFFYTVQEDGIQQAFLDLIIGLADTARGYYYASREVVRTVGHRVFFFVGEGNDDDDGGYSGYPLAQKDVASHSQNNNNTNGSGSSGRRGSNHKRYSSLGQPPPLVLVVRNNNSTVGAKNEPIVVSSTMDDSSRIAATATATATAAPRSRSSQSEVVGNKVEPLEPAFLDKDKYPEGWLVYHPVLGVIAVKEAERYDEQQLQLLAVAQKEKQQHPPKTEELHPQRSETNIGVDIGLVAKTTATTDNYCS